VDALTSADTVARLRAPAAVEASGQDELARPGRPVRWIDLAPDGRCARAREGLA